MYSTMKTADTKVLGRWRARSKPSPVNQPVRTALLPYLHLATSEM